MTRSLVKIERHFQPGDVSGEVDMKNKSARKRSPFFNQSVASTTGLLLRAHRRTGIDRHRIRISPSTVATIEDDGEGALRVLRQLDDGAGLLEVGHGVDDQGHIRHSEFARQLFAFLETK